MKRAICILALATFLVVPGSIAASAESPEGSTADPTQRVSLSGISHDISVRLDGQFVDSGRLTAIFAGCRSHRTVLLKGRELDGHVSILDRDRTSIGGAWATRADYDGFIRVKAKVKRSSFLRAPGHRRVCLPDAVTWKPKR